MRVFIEPLIAYLPKAKLLLNHTEGMLDPGPDSGLLSVTRSILVREFSTIVALLVDQDARLGRGLLHVFLRYFSKLLSAKVCCFTITDLTVEVV
jgi:hypothetical protein